jgi:hypothetical protein
MQTASIAVKAIKTAVLHHLSRLLLRACIIPLPRFAVGLSAAVILCDVVSGFHELTPCLVFPGRRFSPTILRSTTTAPVWVYYGSKRDKDFGC